MVCYLDGGRSRDAPAGQGDRRLGCRGAGGTYGGSAGTGCREEKPACRHFTAVQAILVLLSSCCRNYLNVAALIRFHTENFRTTLVYSYLDIIGKRGHL